MAYPVAEMAPVTLPGSPAYIKVVASIVHHADHGFMRKGDRETKVLRFADFDEARNVLTLHNEEEADLRGWHYTGFYIPSACGRYAASFSMFDISELWDRFDFTGEGREKRHWEPGAKAFNARLNNLTRSLSAANTLGHAERASAIRAQIETLGA